MIPATTQISNRGFTLIELSIVLVIIGLLVGGVLAGNALIQQAEIRAGVSQLQRFQTIFYTFRSKYGCEAGDCPNATDFFGVGYMNNVDCIGMTNGIGNGNNNGRIDEGGGIWSCEGESAVYSLISANLMPSSNTIWDMKGIHDSMCFLYYDDISGEYTNRYKSTISWATEAGGFTRGGAFSPMEGQSIDIKIDDGVPSKGRFIGLDTSLPSGGATVANSCSTSDIYNNNETRTCRSIYYYQ